MSRFLPCFLMLAGGWFFLSKHRAGAQTFTVDVVLNQAELGKDRDSYQPAMAKSTHAIPAWGKTEDESSLTIEFNSENRFRLLPDSEAEVTTGGESDSSSAWHRVVSLKFGRAAIDHTPDPRQRFTSIARRRPRCAARSARSMKSMRPRESTACRAVTFR